MKKSRLLGAVCASFFVLIPALSDAVILPLEGRLETVPGSGNFLAYFDPNLNITWATDANINGLDTWDNQMAWVAGLTIGGVSSWRLPSADVNGNGNVAD